MSDVLSLKESCKPFVQRLSSLDAPLRFVVRQDADCLAAAAILSKTFQRAKLNFSISFYKDLDLALEELLPQPFLFIGFGGEKVEHLSAKLEKPFFIIDLNAKPSESVLSSPDFFVSTLAYLLAESFSPKNKDLVFLALLPFTDSRKLPDFLLQTALASKTVLSRKGISALASFTQPLHKMLEFCINPFLPGVSGSEEGCISFLKEAGIALKEGKSFRSLSSLSEQDLQHLLDQVKMKTSFAFDQDQRDVFLLADEDSQLKDLREFFLLLESCALLHKPSLAVSACLASSARSKAIDIMREYRKDLITSLYWFLDAEIHEKDNFVVIDASSHLREELALVFFKYVQKAYDPNKVFFLLSHTLDNRVSILAGSLNEAVDLKKVLLKLDIGGDIGRKGAVFHTLIPQESEQDFIQKLLSLCETAALEEIIQ